MKTADYTRKIFICCAYIYSDEKNKNISEKAKKAYDENDRTVYKEAWAVADHLNGKNSDIKDINIRILKGGSFKIKEYYLENYTLPDIRGASNLLTYTEETVIPDLIADKFISEVIVYNGGGNLFAILPENVPDSFPMELEEKASEYLITGQTAYILTKPLSIRSIFGPDYKETMRRSETELEQRKKVKIPDSFSKESSMNGREIYSGIIAETEKCGKKTICEACRIRPAVYRESRSEYARNVCAGCLHKATVGRKVKSRYLDEYKKYTGKTPQKINTLYDIGDNIAIVYGDGNNMGGIIQNITKITQMMEFSENVKYAANKSVFEAMAETETDRFEVVGLGGDDVFVIVPGEKAVEFSAVMSKKYKEEFERMYPDAEESTRSTMSVGIAVASTDTPIKLLLESAEEQLKSAKSWSKNNDKDDGSLSFTDLTDRESTALLKNINDTLLPYSISNALKIIDYTKKLRTAAGKTKLRNILDGYNKAESIDEADLYFDYMNARDSRYKIYLPELDGFKIKSGHYEKDGKIYSIWKDIIKLYDRLE